MATRKTHDLLVKTGSYTNGQGEQKNRYDNIGSMMEGDNGPFIILKRTFNPAGVINPENKDSLIVSCFEPNNNQQGGGQQQRAPQQQAPTGGFDDSIPFAAISSKLP